MSRTVHHIVYDYRDSTRAKAERDAHMGVAYVWNRRQMFTTRERHSITTLRYSAAEIDRAEQDGRRPRPQQRRHRLEAYEYPRTYGIGHVVSSISNRQERALRAANRIADRKARQVLRGAQDAVEAAWELDWPDPRHRHFGVWDSW